jgi:hypothetical protein
MIPARDIITEVRQRGVDLWTDGEFLRFKGPKGALTDDLKARLIENRSEIMARLRDAKVSGNKTPNGQFRYSAGNETPKNPREDRVSLPLPLLPPEIVNGDETFSNPFDLDGVLAFDARLLGQLPLPPVLVVDVAGFDSTVVLDLRERPAWRRKPKARPSFSLGEIEALVEGTENGRVRPRDFLSWCQRKQREPYWHLTRETALEGADGLIRRPPESKNWTVGRLLDALDAKLKLIRIVDPSVSEGAKTAGHGPYAEGVQ